MARCVSEMEEGTATESLLPENRRSSNWKREFFLEEMKKVSRIAIPMVLVTVSQHFVRVLPMMMLGHVSELSLSAAAVATSLTNVTGFIVIFGMASALETLCGQAFGAKQFHKLGTYTYAAIIALLVVCIPISILWVYLDKLLILIGQDPEISVEAGKYAIWLITSIFPYAILQCLTRHLQMQSLVFPMLVSAAATTCFHIVVCWALVFWFNLGIVGGALSVGLSYWFNAALLALYMMFSASCENTRSCLWEDLCSRMGEFFRFAVPSSSMSCLEMWTFEVIVLLGGLLPNPQLQTSVLSICLMVISLHFYIPFSVGAGASTRISNELGAGNPETAKMATWAVMVLGFAEMFVASIAVLACGNILGYAFSAEEEVVEYIRKMSPLISVMFLTDGTQGVISGVARGSGWQDLGAYVNLAAYYLVGVPVSVVLGFWVGLGGMGLWLGLNVASILQTIVFLLITIFTDWEKQAAIAKERLMCQGSSERLIVD
ncbi:PREDICTED: protein DETOXIFICATION 14-like [Ipomoea nil]|uniref:protein DETOXIFICATION 14-like n=1 Tax=Ipomoea nil TaxID=35883 RepID=UPI0009008562|nr:PREDICTED: protein DETOXIFICATION 14-like [Ipomoea nil]